MKAITSPTRTELDALSDAVDAALGYPLPGVDVGGGIHVPPAQSMTRHHSAVVQHPTLPEFAYSVDAESAAVVEGLRASTFSLLAAPVELAALEDPAFGMSPVASPALEP